MTYYVKSLVVVQQNLISWKIDNYEVKLRIIVTGSKELVTC